MKNLCVVAALLLAFFLCRESYAQSAAINKCVETNSEKEFIKKTHEYSVESFYDYPIAIFHGCAIVKLEIWTTGRVISAKVIRSSGSPVEDWQKAGLQLRFKQRRQQWTGLVHIIGGAEDYGNAKRADGS